MTIDILGRFELFSQVVVSDQVFLLKFLCTSFLAD